CSVTLSLSLPYALPILGRDVALVLEFAHALVEERGQIGQAVGDRRVDGEAPGVDGAVAHAVLAAAGVVAALRDRDQFLEDLDLRSEEHTSELQSRENLV